MTVRPDGTCTFTQPAGKVKIEVTYKPIQPVESPWNDPFTDVAERDWYYEAVRFVQERGLMNGYSDGRFGSNDPISHEQLAVMLWRHSGSPAATNKELHFNNTDEISGFALEAMRWAVEHGIVNGYGNGWLGPQGQVTRAQVAQMLKNYIENQEEHT